MDNMIRPLIVILFFVFLSFAAQAKATKDDRCFSMNPVANVDDTSCNPVKVRIQFKDCASGSATGKAVEAFAHFDCRTNPPKLKYWYQGSMLFANLRKDGASYAVTRTYAYNYGKNDSEDKDISLNTPVVLPPTATANPQPTPGTNSDSSTGAGAAVGAGAVAAGAAAGNSANSAGTGATAGVAADTGTGDSLANDALKAKALAELSEPAPNNSAAPSVAGAPPVVATAPVASPTPPLPPAVTEAPAVQLTNAGKSLADALARVQVGASVDAFYSYNFNVPSSTTSPNILGQPPTPTNVYLLPNAYHDQFTLALARVSVYEDANPVGFHVDLGFGPLAGFINNNSDATTENLLQGYLSYKLPYDIVIDAGKFYSNLGFENVDPALNWNYSYSYLFRYLTPNWSSGVRATAPIGDRIGVGVYLTNGPETFYNIHRTRDLGGQIRISPIDSVKVIFNYLNGDEGQAAYSDLRTTYEGIALYTPIDSLKIAADYVFSQENGGAAQANLQATSFVVSANYNFWDRLYIIPRYEILNDGGVSWGTANPAPAPALALSPGGQTINAYTVGLEYRPVDSFRLQAEFRQDQSSQLPFNNSSGPMSSQTVATLAAMVVY